MMIGSLFSGIGGLELGLEWAGLGPTVWQVEKDPFCRSVLARHWPNCERFEDVEKVGSANLARVDIICGGFPCQDVSSAGKGAGLAGSRSGLWHQFSRIVGELEPQWVVVENVTSGANRWFDAVVRDLGQRGYDCLPIPLSAADVGANHLRRRIFIIAHSERVRVRNERQRRSGGRSRRVCSQGNSELADDGASRNVADPDNGAEHALAGLGEMASSPGTHGASGNAADPCARLQGSESESGELGWRVPAESAWANESMPEPAIRKMDDGIPSRVARLRSLGNAVVPQCAEVIGEVINLLQNNEKECNK